MMILYWKSIKLETSVESHGLVMYTSTSGMSNTPRIHDHRQLACAMHSSFFITQIMYSKQVLPSSISAYQHFNEHIMSMVIYNNGFYL